MYKKYRRAHCLLLAFKHLNTTKKQLVLGAAYAIGFPFFILNFSINFWEYYNHGDVQRLLNGLHNTLIYAFIYLSLFFLFIFPVYLVTLMLLRHIRCLNLFTMLITSIVIATETNVFMSMLYSVNGLSLALIFSLMKLYGIMIFIHWLILIFQCKKSPNRSI